MLTASTVYVPRSSLKQFSPSPFILAEILLPKLIVILTIFVLPEILNQDKLSWLLTVLFALQFWVTKNAGRRLLHIAWYIDTSGPQQRLVYQASLSVPAQGYEFLFWYSFLFYQMILLVMLILSLVVGRLSLGCALAIGIVCNTFNFYVFSKIMKLRNNGALKMIAKQTIPEVQDQGDYTIKMPFTNSRSRNKPSAEESQVSRFAGQI